MAHLDLIYQGLLRWAVFFLEKQLNVYIAGPMRGRKHNNFPAFDWTEKLLTEAGFDVINPAQLDRDSGLDQDAEPDEEGTRECLKRDTTAILESADMVVLIDGWEKSRGALMEKLLGEAVPMPVMEIVSHGKKFVLCPVKKGTTN